MADFRTIVVHGAAALAELDRLRGEAAATGLRPVLLGGPEQIEHLFPVVHGRSRPFGRPTVTRKRYEPARVAATLAAAAAIDPARWFEERAREEEEFAGDDEDDVGSPEEVEWPVEPPSHGVSIHRDLLTREFLPEVVIGLFPMAATWEVFAHLDYGGWNGCPEAALHCAIQRSWAERFGAEVVGVTGDAVECTVARPPADRDSCLALAREQSFYNGDLVDQGAGSVEALAASLWRAPTWYFWWD